MPSTLVLDKEIHLQTVGINSPHTKRPIMLQEFVVDQVSRNYSFFTPTFASDNKVLFEMSQVCILYSIDVDLGLLNKSTKYCVKKVLFLLYKF